MAGMLSLRVTKEERIRLQRIKEERGCQSLSEAIRLQLGFDRGVGEELDGADDIENVAKLCSQVIYLRDRLDEQHQLLTKIARHLEIPMQERPHAAASRRVRPAVEIPIPVNGREMDGDEPIFATRGGRNHPDLPDGFVRT